MATQKEEEKDDSGTCNNTAATAATTATTATTDTTDTAANPAEAENRKPDGLPLHHARWGLCNCEGSSRTSPN
jgi:hypothetical protein